jgi:hypothetical protein
MLKSIYGKKKKLICANDNCKKHIKIVDDVWRWRAEKARYNSKGISRDYYCDSCADKIERGYDM